MKKLLFSLTAVLALSTGLFAQKKADEMAKFSSETIDLGKIKQDIPATATFIVTNIGTEPLIIEQANPTCGCTIGDYTKEPIAPGKTGTIKATYNAKALNNFEKHLTVKFAGAPETKSITIKGEVLTTDEYAKQMGGGADAIKTATAATTTPAAAMTTDSKMAATTTKPAAKAMKTKSKTTATKMKSKSTAAATTTNPPKK